jgi:branched-chain amino acid transport system substrate-binding protein
MGRRIFLLFGLLVFLSIGLSLPEAGADVKVIKLANISPLSGPAAAWGIAGARGHQMSAEDIGVFKVAGQDYKWEIVNYDSKYVPSDALSALNKAIFQDNIRYGWITGSGVHPPLMPLLRQNWFVDMANIAGGKKFTNPENPTLFRVMASTDQCIMTFFDDIYKMYKTKRVAVIVPNDEMGKADWELLLRLHKERKPEAEVVAEEFFERGMTDFYPPLKRMLAKNPDMIFSDASPTGTVALIAKQSRELGFKGVIYNPTAVLEAKVLWDTAGKASDNVLVPRMWAEPPTKLYADLERRYVEKYKEPMLALYPEIYPLLPWITKAIQKAGSIDTQKVIPVLADMPNPDHPCGPAKWGGEKFYGIKRQIVYPVGLCILQDQKWKLVMKKVAELE